MESLTWRAKVFSCRFTALNFGDFFVADDDVLIWFDFPVNSEFGNGMLSFAC